MNNYIDIKEITKANNHGYSMIFRQDTQNYSDMDIMFEVDEWIDILKNILKKEPSYEIVELRHSTRAERFLAKTGYKKSGLRGHLTINDTFLRKHSDPNIFHSVIAHECIHTFPGAFNHGEAFKAYGRMLMRRCNFITISRQISDTGYTEALLNKRKEDGTHQKKYLVQCQNCGQKIFRERVSKIVTDPDAFKCGICGGKFLVSHL